MNCLGVTLPALGGIALSACAAQFPVPERLPLAPPEPVVARTPMERLAASGREVWDMFRCAHFAGVLGNGRRVALIRAAIARGRPIVDAIIDGDLDETTARRFMPLGFVRSISRAAGTDFSLGTLHARTAEVARLDIRIGLGDDLAQVSNDDIKANTRKRYRETGCDGFLQ